MRVGIVLPGSTYLPRLGPDLAAAFEAGFGGAPGGPTCELVIETTPYNASERELGPKIQDLIVKHRVDVVVAALNAGLAEPLGRISSTSGTPLVVLSLGEDLVTVGPDHGVVTVSFDLWRAAWMSGFWSVGAHGERAATIAGLHDGGYGMVFAFGLGAEAAGGHVAAAQVTHVDSADDDPAEQIDAVLDADPAVVMAFYSGREGSSFLDAWNRRTSRTPPLMWLPDLGERRAGAPPAVPAGTRSVGSWTGTVDQTPGDATDTGAGLANHAYTVLAREAGALVADAARRQTADPSGDLLGQLVAAVATGPRGRIEFDRTTGTTSVRPLGLFDVRAGTDAIEHHRLEPLDVPPLLDEQLQLARERLPKTGWTNPYLIA